MSGLSHRVTAVATAARLRLELRRRAAYDRLDDEQRAAWRAERLAALRDHAVRHSPGYRTLHRGLEAAPLGELPIVSKDDIVDRFDDLVTDRALTVADVRRRIDHDDERAAGGYRIAASSGSSGRPGLVPFAPDEWVQLLTAAARSRTIAGPTPGGGGAPVRSARVGSPSPWHLSVQLPATIPDPRRPARVLSAATDVAELRAELADWQPHVLTAYPSVLGALAAEQLAGRFDIGPRQVFSGGERLRPAVSQAVEDAWGTRPFDQYVTAEGGFLAVDCPQHDGMHVLDDHVLVEVVDGDGLPVEPGVQGQRVLITVLGSRTLPLIRYELGDAAVLAEGRCRCGRRSPRIASVATAGRTLLSLPAPDGRQVQVHPVVFTSVVDLAPVRAWQVVRRRDRLDVLVVDPAPELDRAGLAGRLAAALAGAGATPLPIEVTEVDELRRAPSGKAGLVVADD